MGFDGAVNGDNYLFGESVSLIDYMNWVLFLFSLRLLADNFSLLILVPLWLALKWPPAFEFNYSSDLLKLQRRSIAKC